MFWGSSGSCFNRGEVPLSKISFSAYWLMGLFIQLHCSLLTSSVLPEVYLSLYGRWGASLQVAKGQVNMLLKRTLPLSSSCHHMLSLNGLWTYLIAQLELKTCSLLQEPDIHQIQLKHSEAGQGIFLQLYLEPWLLSQKLSGSFCQETWPTFALAEWNKKTCSCIFNLL